MRGALHDAEEFVKEIGGEEAGDFARVELWRDFDEIGADDVEATERAH